MSSDNSGKRKRVGIPRALFYKKKDSKSESEESLGDISASDDSVDDPGFVPQHGKDKDKDVMDEDDSDSDIFERDSGDVGEGSVDAVVQAIAGSSRDDDAIAGGSGVVPDSRCGEDARGVRGRERVRGTMREKRGRAPTRHPSKKQRAKAKKDHGEEYVDRGGNVKQGKKIGPACNDGCYDRVTEQARKAIFTNFWRLGSYNAQSNYISQNVRDVKVKRRYGKGKRETERRKNEYHVKYRNETFKVCAKAFRNIHDISEKRIRIQMNRMHTSATGTPPGDMRGKKVPPQKITGARLERVHEHIRSLPVTASHYSRAKSPHRTYLESGGTIRGLYSMYKYWLQEKEYTEEPVNEVFYRHIFTTEYNISFKPTKTDTCATCDELKATKEGMTERGEDTSALDEKLEQHQAMAATAQDLLRAQATLVEPVRGLVVRSVSMDLQQTLPCPQITTGLAYYLRKLWVYNFCIHDLHRQRGTMFVWDEVTGGRGSDEISSCLMKWLQLRQDAGDEFDVLRIFCDNCAGQNKNLFVLLSALRHIHSRRVFRIEIIFMISGHSFLPCDRDFGVLEKKFRLNVGLHTTAHYVQAMKEAANPPFEVITMEREEFFDFKALSKFITKRPTQVSFSQARQLIVDCGYKEGYILKSNYNLEDNQEGYYRSRLMKGNRKYADKLFNLSEFPLEQKYKQEIILNAQKVSDLKTLTQFLGPSASRNWMIDLTDRQLELQNTAAAASHDDDDDDVGSDAENDLDDYVIPPSRH